MASLLVIDSRYHYLRQWLTDLDVDLTAQGKNHTRNLLCHIHACLEVCVDSLSVDGRPLIEMYALQLTAEVMVELVGKERRKRREEFVDNHQTGVECVVGRAFVGAHLLTPEALTVQTHIPVGQVVVDEGVDETAGACRVVVVELFLDALDKAVELGDNPTVNLRSVLGWPYSAARGLIAVDIGVEGEEGVRII